ncbi:MAG TPA: endonuclease/exonuclease/phosphatase family protein [Candidatus Limnocylindria bacterium]|nr:endonuclease/exonuclease/phosphatase family protein [Candidatus Limnocylindria bacterium]
MPTLTALSYNIHECVGLDKRRDPSRIGRIIKESGAQIVGLQEVHSESSGIDELHQMNYLASVTGLQAVPGPALERRNGHYGNVLLTSGHVRAVHKLDLSFPGREARGAIDADLEFDGQTVRVIVTHLGLLPAERRFQVEKLLRILEEDRAPLVILLTDFNEWLPVGRPLRWIHTRLGKTVLVRTFPSAFPVFALDRIWVSPASALIEIHTIRDPITRIASDHLPLKATLRTPNGAHSGA